ncbi:ATP-dependent DNA helicase PIF1 [Biomphalaria glabrata]|nr:ATP-dependent DNA helicase PIF1 [Biomphalaria glabrata]
MNTKLIDSNLQKYRLDLERLHDLSKKQDNIQNESEKEPHLNVLLATKLKTEKILMLILLKTLETMCRRIVTNSRPFYVYLAGAAGVGKSLVIRTIIDTLTHYFNRIEGNDPDRIRILPSSYTGTAAYNIGGIILHIHDINYYLQMLFNRDDLPFGGKSVLAVGDFQLKPVFDKSIYETVSEPGAAKAPPL